MTRRGTTGSTWPSGAAQAILVLLVSALLLPAGPVAAQDDPAEGEEIIHFIERPFEANRDRWNFTVFPPDENETGRDRQASQATFPTFRASWIWYVPATIENWSLSAGTQWDFYLYISGMDEVHPMPTFSSLTSGGHEIVVEISRGEDMVGSTSSVVPLLEVEEGVQEYFLSVEFDEDLEFSTDDELPRLGFTIMVSGRGEGPESPLHLHFGSEKHSSRVVARTYPTEGLKQWELDYLLKEECQRLLLQQRSCNELQRPKENETGNGPEMDGGPVDDEGDGETGTRDGDDDEREEEGASGITGLGVLLWVGLLVDRLRRRTRE